MFPGHRVHESRATLMRDYRDVRERWLAAFMVRVAGSNKEGSNLHIKGVQKRQRWSPSSQGRAQTNTVEVWSRDGGRRRVTQGTQTSVEMMRVRTAYLHDSGRRTSSTASSAKRSADDQSMSKRCTNCWASRAQRTERPTRCLRAASRPFGL